MTPSTDQYSKNTKLDINFGGKLEDYVRQAHAVLHHVGIPPGAVFVASEVNWDAIAPYATASSWPDTRFFMLTLPRQAETNDPDAYYGA